MNDIQTSLLREKFIIRSANTSDSPEPEVITALSNRMVLTLTSARGSQETFVVRAHNMHSCVRMTAKILAAHQHKGSLVNRATAFNWEGTWDSVCNAYEHSYNPSRWIAVYYDGKALFEYGERHPLLDVIESCDHTNNAAYELCIPLAEDLFKKTGTDVSIDYDGNVALAVHLEKKQSRCGIILRGADRTTTFSFSVTAHDGSRIDYVQCLNSAGAFLEGIQMAFMVGMNGQKIKSGAIERHSQEERKTFAATKRLNELSATIKNMEAMHDIHYRPERPDFLQILSDAEEIAKNAQ